uniref:Uncharacterized protein n=1 Tax=Oncorhynchus mykiss TaxID=8022 RepID=A0A8K9WZL3_ONCMY
MGQLKFNMSEDNNVEMYRNDLPNADTPPAELHCWRVKWKHRGKFFPNVLAFLRVLSNLPVLGLEDVDGNASCKCFQMYLLAFLNIHYNARHDLDFMVDGYAFLTTMNSFSHLVT